MYYLYSKENITFTCAAVVRLQNEGTICETLPGLFNSGSQREEKMCSWEYFSIQKIKMPFNQKNSVGISRIIWK